MPPAPVIDRAAAGRNEATVGWTKVGDEFAVERYWVRIVGESRRQDAGNSSEFTWDGLDEGQTVQFQVQAENAQKAGPWSAPSDEVTPGNQAPYPPVDVVAVPTYKTGELKVSWKAGKRAKAQVTAFQVTADGEECGGPESFAADKTHYTRNCIGLEDGERYTVKVTAVIENDNDKKTSECRPTCESSAEATKPVAPFSKAGTPTNLVVTPRNGAVALSWAAPDHAGGKSLTYTVLVDGKENTRNAQLTR